MREMKKYVVAFKKNKILMIVKKSTKNRIILNLFLLP